MAGPRRNRSNKIPGVKLRPALPNTKSKRKDSGYEQSIEDEDENSSDLDTTFNGDLCPRPFKGVVICATGVDDKTTLFKQAIELGVQPISDLTDRVTHLIAEESGSAKYKCALENGIAIMKPSWIIESHKIWLRGDDVDLQESIRSHKLPVFSNITVSITGFEDMQKRTEIHKLLIQNGGTYVKNIERPVRVTHLICFNSSRDSPPQPSDENASAEEEMEEIRETSDKLKYAEKFNSRKEADIQIVWEDWFWDCLASGGRWDESYYKVGVVTKARTKKLSEERSKKKALQAAAANVSRLRVATSDSALQLDDSHSPAGPSVDNDLDSPAVPDDEEPASIKRVPGVKLALWESLLKPRGFVAEQGKLIRSPSKSQAPGNNTVGSQGDESPTKEKSQRMKIVQEATRDSGEKEKGKGKKSLLATLQRSRSIAPRLQSDSADSSQRQLPPLNRALTTNGFAQPRQPFSPHPEQPPQVPEPAAPQPDTRGTSMEVDGEGQPEAGPSNINIPSFRTGIFVGMTFRLLGEARSANVKDAIESAGGKVLRANGEAGSGDDDDDDENVDIVLVRLVSGSTIFHSASLTIPPAKFRTECWLERCLFEERICAPEEHVSFRPLENKDPIKGVESVILSHSGLESSEACWLRRLARALGISIAPSFSRRSTHLICPSRSGYKFDKAVEWSIPVIDMDWFEEMVRVGYVPGMEQSMDSGNIDVKGKGKSRAMDTMTDITNNGPAVTARRSRSPAPMDIDNAPQEEFAFGKPHLLLDGPPSSPSHSPIPELDHHPDSPPGTSPPASRAPTLEPQSSQSILPPLSDPPIPAQHNRTNSHNDPQAQAQAPAGPTPSQLALQYDKEHTQVPSSHTPSPIKLVSPRRPMSRESSSILNDKLTSLLGKRQASDVQETDISGVITTPEPQAPVRPKRGRPPSRSKIWEDKSRADAPNVSSSLGPGDTTVSITSPEKTVERPPPEDISLDYDAPSQVAQRDKLLRMLQNPGQSRDAWEPSLGDDDDASVIVLSGPPPPKKPRPAKKAKSAQVAVTSVAQSNVPPRPRPKPRKKGRVSKS